MPYQRFTDPVVTGLSPGFPEFSVVSLTDATQALYYAQVTQVGGDPGGTWRVILNRGIEEIAAETDPYSDDGNLALNAGTDTINGVLQITNFLQIHFNDGIVITFTDNGPDPALGGNVGVIGSGIV